MGPCRGSLSQDCCWDFPGELCSELPCPAPCSRALSVRNHGVNLHKKGQSHPRKRMAACCFFWFSRDLWKVVKETREKKKKLLCTQELIAPSFQRVCIHSLASLRFVFPWGLFQHLPRWEPALQPSPWSGHLRGLAYSISTCLDPSSNVSLLKLAGGFPNY